MNQILTTSVIWVCDGSRWTAPSVYIFCISIIKIVGIESKSFLSVLISGSCSGSDTVCYCCDAVVSYIVHRREQDQDRQLVDYRLELDCQAYWEY